MSKFPDALLLRVLTPIEVAAEKKDVALYRLLAPFRFESEILGVVEAPIDFTTDFASIPRAALWYMKDDDPGILFASVIHDYLYTLEGVLPTSQTYTRDQADQVLAEGMKVCGARRDQIAVVYRTVRLFGGRHWK